ncbi:MAG: hypothetical protein IPM16_15700 [Chloroflexi bacterium]|nr:hypothetical protein [Chloroflexota bacterium]
MVLSDAAQLMIGLAFISIPTIEFGGRFLLSQLGNPNSVITSAEQAAYFRAGHAHAGVLVILAIVGQIAADSIAVSSVIEWGIRILLFAAPILMSAGFFLGAPTGKSKRPGRLISILYGGALCLAVGTIGLGGALIFT